MQFKIGDLANLLNMSPSMIRYYEKCGVIRPARAENNYRIYDVMDFFALSEAVVLSRFDVNIKDIYSLKEEDFSKNIVSSLRLYADKTDEKMKHLSLTKERALEIAERIDTASVNLNNCWVKRVKSHVTFQMLHSIDDEYDHFLSSKNVQQIMCNPDVLPFADGFLVIKDDHEEWDYSVNYQYASLLHLPIEEGTLIPDEYCLCTIIDMGEIGSFQAESVRKRAAELMKMNYQFTGEVRGLLLGRGKNEGRQHRYMELQLPCKL